VTLSKYNRNYKSNGEKCRDALLLMEKYDCLPIDYHVTRDFVEYLLKRVKESGVEIPD
jgi:hypothetical protein